MSKHLEPEFGACNSRPTERTPAGRMTPKNFRLARVLVSPGSSVDAIHARGPTGRLTPTTEGEGVGVTLTRPQPIADRTVVGPDA
jgi:hypothetical protein